MRRKKEDSRKPGVQLFSLKILYRATRASLDFINSLNYAVIVIPHRYISQCICVYIYIIQMCVYRYTLRYRANRHATTLGQQERDFHFTSLFNFCVCNLPFFLSFFTIYGQLTAIYACICNNSFVASALEARQSLFNVTSNEWERQCKRRIYRIILKPISQLNYSCQEHNSFVTIWFQFMHLKNNSSFSYETSKIATSICSNKNRFSQQNNASEPKIDFCTILLTLTVDVRVGISEIKSPCKVWPATRNPPIEILVTS